MSADYKNWIPNGMIKGFTATSAAMAAITGVTAAAGGKLGKLQKPVTAVLALGTAGISMATLWLKICQDRYSYKGKRQLSKQIIEGTAEYVNIPDGGVGLDVGCGSGALTIACAKRNPNAKMIGIDRWGKEYASFSKTLCENNAEAEGVSNTEFIHGDASSLDFPDEYFDTVTSNYVYHNIAGVNKQELLRETLRVLKKGGRFVIHDIMSKGRYGDMEAFADELRSEGYEKVELIDTTNGKFMTPIEAKLMALSGSTLLVGIK